MGPDRFRGKQGRLPLRAVPWFATGAEGLRLLPLDSRAAYVLSLVDGHTTLEIILDVCGMDREEALRIVRQLIAFDAIRLQEA